MTDYLTKTRLQGQDSDGSGQLSLKDRAGQLYWIEDLVLRSPSEAMKPFLALPVLKEPQEKWLRLLHQLLQLTRPEHYVTGRWNAAGESPSLLWGDISRGRI